jgi:catechol 2,3-dioxygenase-like lactoylglutathione lyase family enzyme
VLTEVLGFRRVGEYAKDASRIVAFEVGPGGPGTEVRLIEKSDAPRARLGRGGVHHVAFRTPDDEEQAAWRERIAEAGLGVTHLIDRYYFRSIYFREPGGVLFEIATDGPGFATDEDAEHLGEKLSLPPFLEERREEIEARLTPIPAAKARPQGLPREPAGYIELVLSAQAAKSRPLRRPVAERKENGMVRRKESGMANLAMLVLRATREDCSRGTAYRSCSGRSTGPASRARAGLWRCSVSIPGVPGPISRASPSSAAAP